MIREIEGRCLWCSILLWERFWKMHWPPLLDSIWLSTCINKTVYYDQHELNKNSKSISYWRLIVLNPTKICKQIFSIFRFVKTITFKTYINFYYIFWNIYLFYYKGLYCIGLYVLHGLSLIFNSQMVSSWLRFILQRFVLFWCVLYWFEFVCNILYWFVWVCM